MNFGAKSPQKLNELTDVLESLPNASNRKTSIIASILNWARDNSIPQGADSILNKIAKPLYETFTGLICMPQKFRICFT